jgi:hypothetical protein
MFKMTKTKLKVIQVHTTLLTDWGMDIEGLGARSQLTYSGGKNCLKTMAIKEWSLLVVNSQKISGLNLKIEKLQTLIVESGKLLFGIIWMIKIMERERLQMTKEKLRDCLNQKRK